MAGLVEEQGEKKSPRLTHKERTLAILTSATVNPDALLDDVEVAALLKCSEEILRIGRRSAGKILSRGEIKNKDLPPHRVIFGRMIRYRYGDVLDWLNNRNGEAA